MDSTAFIAHMELAGFSLALHGEKLRVTPASQLTHQQKEFIRQHRDELIQAVRLRDLELEVSPSGNDHPPANDHQATPFVTIEQLPARLVNAAIRVCREIHQDDDQAVQTMLEDLTWNSREDWGRLIQHFERQLPPGPPKVTPMVTCSGCSHAAPSPHHAGIMHCKAGVESGTATAGWFDTDQHLCAKQEVKAC